MAQAVLLLRDGTVFTGKSCGAVGEVMGEVVFNTGMVGYQEIMTDPSYHGQLVTLSYPMIGNYGISYLDNESRQVFTRGLIIREQHSTYDGHWRSQEELGDFLLKNNVVGIQGIDTRKLVRHLRTHGAMSGIISSSDTNPEKLMARLKQDPGISGRDLITEVTTPVVYEYEEIIDRDYIDFPKLDEEEKVPSIAVYDYGTKYCILQYLRTIARKVIVFPARTPLGEVMSHKPSGIFLSNGPGDPEDAPFAIDIIQQILKDYPRLPMFGICLGHQLLGLALGGKTYKLKFGHHGINHPIKNISTGKVEIASENHNYAVDYESVADRAIKTHINLNDGTLEGIRVKDRPVFSIQFHPEASTGPNDSNYLFFDFHEMIKGV